MSSISHRGQSDWWLWWPTCKPTMLHAYVYWCIYIHIYASNVSWLTRRTKGRTSGSISLAAPPIARKMSAKQPTPSARYVCECGCFTSLIRYRWCWLLYTGTKAGPTTCTKARKCNFTHGMVWSHSAVWQWMDGPHENNPESAQAFTTRKDITAQMIVSKKNPAMIKTKSIKDMQTQNLNGNLSFKQLQLASRHRTMDLRLLFNFSVIATTWRPS